MLLLQGQFGVCENVIPKDLNTVHAHNDVILSLKLIFDN